MKITETKLKGVLIIEPDVFHDERGYFFEAFNKTKYSQAGICDEFVQDNISRSVKNTIRGLHYQVGEFAQGKLCQVIKGEVMDVAVDIRFNSPTFGQYVSVVLDDVSKRQLWIPRGFAHGFTVNSDEALFHYKCSAPYSKNHERAILYNDSALNIDWQNDSPIVSPKDLQAVGFAEIQKEFYYND